MQTKRQSAIETGVNLVVGMGIAYGVNYLILPYLDHQVSKASAELTAVFTLLSLLRQYTLRRIFNYLHHHDTKTMP